MPSSPKHDLTETLSRQTHEAKKELERARISLSPRPRGDFPDLVRSGVDLTMLADDALMEELRNLTAWIDHTAGQLALQEVDERFAESWYDHTYSRVLSDTMAGKTKNEASVTLCKAETTSSSQVMEARSNRDVIYARRKLMQTVVANLERDAFAISRELSRRIGRDGPVRRSERWTGA